MVGYWKSVALTAFILVLVAGRARAEDVERTIYVPQGCYMPIHKEFFGDHRPAWTAVGTTVLLSRTAPVEMRVVAVVGSGKASRVVYGEEPATDAAETEPAESPPK